SSQQIVDDILREAQTEEQIRSDSHELSGRWLGLPPHPLFESSQDVAHLRIGHAGERSQRQRRQWPGENRFDGLLPDPHGGVSECQVDLTVWEATEVLSVEVSRIRFGT